MPPAPHPASRLLTFALALSALALGALTVHLDARQRRSDALRARPLHRAAARVVGFEPSLHAASRWLRHPTRTEPWAPFSDGPALLDTDPAGALAPPPRALFSGYASRVERRP